MIEIKSFFGDWYEVDREKAKDYALFWLSRIGVQGKQNKINYVNARFLRGITVEELLDEI